MNFMGLCQARFLQDELFVRCCQIMLELYKYTIQKNGQFSWK